MSIPTSILSAALGSAAILTGLLYWTLIRSQDPTAPGQRAAPMRYFLAALSTDPPPIETAPAGFPARDRSF